MTDKRRHIRMILMAALAVMAALAGPVIAPVLAAQEGEGAEIFTAMARDMRARIEKAAPQMAACAPVQEKVKVGILPFDPARAPLPRAALRRIYNDMLAALSAQPLACAAWLDAASMRAILRHLQQSGAYDRLGAQAFKALREENAQADLLLVGEITAAAGHFYLTYRLIERKSGRLLARIAERELPESLIAGAAADAALPVNAAMEKAARALLGQAADISALWVGPITYEDSGRQTSGGRFIRDRLKDRIAQAAANVITGKALRMVSTMQGADAHTYALSGHYRVMGDAIDLSVELKNPAGKVASWNGMVRIDGLEGLFWRPVNDPQAGAANAATASPEAENAFSFELVTAHGTPAFYAPGESLQLKLRLGQAAYVYCYYTGVRGEVAQIAPNPRMRAKSGQVSLRVKRSVLRVLPEAARDGFRLRINPRAPEGKAVVRCYAASRDVTAELPYQLRGESAKTIPHQLAQMMDEIFAALPGVKLARAKVAITITGR